MRLVDFQIHAPTGTGAFDQARLLAELTSRKTERFTLRESNGPLWLEDELAIAKTRVDKTEFVILGKSGALARVPIPAS